MRTKTGTVVSSKQDKTVVVRVDRYVNHPKYHKRYRVSKKFYAHDEENTAHAGDLVVISETKPLSRLKRWKIDSITAIERVTVRPDEIALPEVISEDSVKPAHVTSAHTH